MSDPGNYCEDCGIHVDYHGDDCGIDVRDRRDPYSTAGVWVDGMGRRVDPFAPPAMPSQTHCGLGLLLSQVRMEPGPGVDERPVWVYECVVCHREGIAVEGTPYPIWGWLAVNDDTDWPGRPATPKEAAELGDILRTGVSHG